ncbi:hypothetical protein GUJ93_ZPchr0002g25218 [Zizania palustris]|uniref:Uncharacterized protein n=1 Tax=Zizania palustris TaxID=103762 RepID=A0A8J5RXL5_ZIZPA|nr:hypothetical protein GUJ93_ZPchr0002g25218 [Zizania palustris]KAG8059878.1 hypothetical protein GUJ93_ZPchr0002g25218 [Zizania palustris]
MENPTEEFRVATFFSDRKSASGMSGEPKKGSRGGKFTWEGVDGYADEDLDLISPKNSNRKAAATASTDSNKKGATAAAAAAGDNDK